MGALERGLGEEDAVVADNADRVAMQPCEPTDQRFAVARLELVKLRAVHNTGDHLTERAAVQRTRSDGSDRGETTPSPIQGDHFPPQLPSTATFNE